MATCVHFSDFMFVFIVVLFNQEFREKALDWLICMFSSPYLYRSLFSKQLQCYSFPSQILNYYYYENNYFFCNKIINIALHFVRCTCLSFFSLICFFRTILKHSWACSTILNNIWYYFTKVKTYYKIFLRNCTLLNYNFVHADHKPWWQYKYVDILNIDFQVMKKIYVFKTSLYILDWSTIVFCKRLWYVYHFLKQTNNCLAYTWFIGL
jgi:hypothetical protein